MYDYGNLRHMKSCGIMRIVGVYFAWKDIRIKICVG
jgi:hypothetical protein